MSDANNILKSARQTALSHLEDLQHARNSLKAATGLNPLSERDRLEAAVRVATGRNLLADYEQELSHLKTTVRYNATAGVGRRLDTSAAPGDAHPQAQSFLSSVGDLGRVVRQTRKEMGLSQQQFADLTGVGRRFVSELEAGKPTLEFGRILKVCQAVGIDLVATKR